MGKSSAKKEKSKREKQRVRRVSIRYQLLVPVGLMLILLACVIGLSVYYESREGYVEMAMEQANTIASLVADSIDAEQLADLNAKAGEVL